MITYEVTLPEKPAERVTASGWTWDKTNGALRFYDDRNNVVAAYRRGEWLELHTRSPLAKADPIHEAETFAMYGVI